MSVVSGVVVYVMVWWVVLFAFLPQGVKTAERPEPGMADGAPESPRVAAKMLMTTAVSAAIWLAIYLVVTQSGFSFREWAKTL